MRKVILKIKYLFVAFTFYFEEAEFIRANVDHVSLKTNDMSFKDYLNIENIEQVWKVKPEIIDSNGQNWIRSVDRGISGFRYKRQTGNGFTRKEIRMLSPEERRRFFDSCNALKNDVSVHPNLWDFIAEYHSGNVLAQAHGGPNFLSWHRIYLLRLEFALKQKDPTVTLPYWDSEIDAELDDPTLSILWTPDFLGNGFEDVNRGPFANWTNRDGSPLRRNIGFLGSLIRRNDLERLISTARNHADIVVHPNLRQVGRPFSMTIEGQHNGVHTWVGGTMNGLITAPGDPVFYLHHCFVDLMWERAREQIRRRGVDPRTDYVEVEGVQRSTNNMTRFEFLRNIHGYSDVWTRSYYRYEDQPSCSSTSRQCPSEHLRCVESRFETGSFVCTSTTSNYILDVSPEVRYRSAIVDLNTDVGPRFSSESTDVQRAGLLNLINQNSTLTNDKIRALTISIWNSPEVIKTIPADVRRQLIFKMFNIGWG